MHLYLKPSVQMIQAANYVDILRNSLAEIGNGESQQFIHASRTERGTMYTYGARTVEFCQLPDDDEFWLELRRGTKGSTRTYFNDEEVVESVNITLNWLIHQEFSSRNHIELTERLAKEAREYDQFNLMP